MTTEDWKGLPEIDYEVLQLFPNFTKEDIIQKAREIREKSLSTDFYCCIDGLHFLKFGLKHNPFYGEVFQEGKLSELRILDIGCCFGVDIRGLILDGADINNVFGIDLSDSLISLGFELFGDAERLKGHFIEADATSKDFVNTVSEKTGGKFDLIILQLVLHTVADSGALLIQNVFRLLNTGGKLIGCTLGTEEDLDEELKVGVGRRRRFIHSERTLSRLFSSCGFTNITVKFCKWNPQKWSVGWIENNFSFSLKNECLGFLIFRCMNVEF
ncbi:hypothetical protein Gasu2_19130 [Galdieria sulphuraria]|uniref:Uncharacterized protein n=1 Tax=Galdieria sulphuraria TaxID=130081 RepID=M2XUX5_GALSU|nr:uncharacterized protein Gasu_51950 [Galdieria sulphuraria]EME27214.1 hypothetical protein Gasu_51950 [Galdieria sulphuraria]GJD07560.1 hypothetical protein Gasu2_19130 [Galdieria sulphuraria]|eukprot:XP_005703734.1 hypothetical protein Gasu_51950 [Galdieria sulphuraria]